MPITSMRFSSGPARKVPAVGDTRTTKKYGLQFRIPEYHNGMRVVSNGRPRYVWCRPEDLPPLYRRLYADYLAKGTA